MISVLEVLRGLQRITASDRGSTRIAYTALEEEAHEHVWRAVREVAGFVRVTDAAGNLFVIPEAAAASGAAVLLMGSHLDTVIEGGWLDGTLGVAAAMHALSRLASDGLAHPRAGMVVFRDEEGVRFNTGLFGSRVFAGLCRESDLDVADADGVRVREVVPDPAGCLQYAPPVTPAAFLECHIEQGVRLTDHGRRIGVVTGIVGIRRFVLRGVGQANHAGTTEMRRRIDALVPVAQIIGRLPALVEDQPDAVITCGRLRVEPGAPNIVPGLASAIVEIRASDDATLDEIESRLRATVAATRPGLEGGRVAEVALTHVVTVDPVVTDGTLSQHLTEVLTAQGVEHEHLPSMAGHDTQHAAHRCPAGMFFIPSVGGISHNPDESSTDGDVTLAGDVMTAWAERYLAAPSSP